MLKIKCLKRKKKIDFEERQWIIVSLTNYSCFIKGGFMSKLTYPLNPVMQLLI